jgi:hypothetical protein
MSDLAGNKVETDRGAQPNQVPRGSEIPGGHGKRPPHGEYSNTNGIPRRNDSPDVFRNRTKGLCFHPPHQRSFGLWSGCRLSADESARDQGPGLL